MKNTITRVDALNFAIDTISHIEVYGEEVARMDDMVNILTKIRDQIAKPRKTSDEAKAKRKEKNAQARATLMEQVLPVIREGISDGGTAKEIFERCKDVLPSDFTSNKVQYILLHEMKDEVEKIEAKNKPNIYKIKRV